MIARFASRTRSGRNTSSTGSPPKNTIKPGRLESMARTLAHQQSAVDLDDLADQVVCRGRGQKQDRPYRLLRRPLSAHGDGLRLLLPKFRRGKLVMKRRRYDAGRYPIDQDILGDQLLGHSPRQRANPALGRRVGYRARPSAIAGSDGGDVDDPTPPLPLHNRQHRLPDQKDGLEVDLHDAIPQLPGHLFEGATFDQGPRVVDQDIEPPIAILYLPDHPLDIP